MGGVCLFSHYHFISLYELFTRDDLFTYMITYARMAHNFKKCIY